MESPKAVTDENFKMVNYGMNNYRSYDENGYYDVLQRDDYKGSNITFADFSSATETYLCNRAECKHNDDTCTSFFGNEYNSIRLFPSYEDDKILCLANYYPESGACFLRLLSFDRNGENRQVVIDFGIDTDTIDGVGTYPEKSPAYKTAFIFNRDDHISPHVPSWAIRAVLTTDNIRLLEPQKTRTEEDTESWI